jgi:FkbH-like protein
MMNDDVLNAIARVKIEPTYVAYSALANLAEKAGEQGFELCRIAVLRNFTIEPMIPVIKGEAVRLGLAPDVYVADFDAIAESVMTPSSQLYTHKPHIILLAQWAETVSPLLMTKFLTLSKEQVDGEVTRIVDTMENWLRAIRSNCDAPVLVNNFPLPNIVTLGILDYQSESHQIHTVLILNNALLKMSKNFSDVYWVDTLSLFARVGYATAVDERNWQAARAPISKHALLPLGLEYAKFIRALRGKTRKCLVLDCDNTLWGGVVGEDGLDGIKLGNTHPGSSYVAFQQECLNLYNRGVILALCSKNNEADVFEVFKKHPDSVLKEHHFASWQINWDDKATNLTRIAEELNIGIDSLVFVDDSPFECDWIRKQLPQVEVVNLTKETYNYRKELMLSGYFDSLTFSSEDKKRSQMYVSDNQRKQLLKTASSFEDYLNGLDLQASIGRPDKSDVPRISQLTQKTNQFNVTTRRYTVGDIERFMASDDAEVFFLKLSDRVSDLGLIGVAIVQYKNDFADIDSLMMSCRALGRGAEETLLSLIYKRAKHRGCIKLVGTYLKSKKNALVYDFYLKYDFKLVEESPEGTKWEQTIDSQLVKDYPKWIAVKETNLYWNPSL